MFIYKKKKKKKKLFQKFIYINFWKSSQRMNLRDVESDTSVNDSVQTNTNDK